MENGGLPAQKQNAGLLGHGIGMFCDDSRDAIKGSVFDCGDPGFVCGGHELEHRILAGARAHCEPDRPIEAPSQIITYVSAHDNLTLWDKLACILPDEGKRLRANRFAAALYMTFQGNLFFLSGEEFARTKQA